MKKLTPKQQNFVNEYLIDLNATQAAKRAGYSKKTAHRIGQENLHKPTIDVAISKAKKERSDITKIDAAWLLKHLAQEVIADVNDLYDESNNIKPVKEWPLIWRQGLVAGIESGPLGITKIKIADRTKIKELLGKHVDIKAFADKLDVNVAITLEAIVSTANQKELDTADVIPIEAVNDSTK